jgi:hypothetical protein
MHGEKECLASPEQVLDLGNRYQEWLAIALSVVPEEFQPRLRQGYEGKFYSKKINAFLEGPGEVSVAHRSATLAADTSIFSYWQQPFDTTLRHPLLAQRPIPQEARRHLQGADHGESIALVERICRGFGEFLYPFATRQRTRAFWTIDDEYDVQMVLHGLLRIFFSDVRSEDVSPQQGGGSSRLDFFVKDERIAIDAKMTRQGLTRKKVGEELIIDTERYKSHPQCDALVALVYDPDHHIGNPKALESDLSGDRAGLTVQVVVTR